VQTRPVFVTRHETSPAAYRGARALVLGGSGFIGRWVARRLTLAGCELSVAARDAASFDAIATEWEIDAAVVPFDAMIPGSIGRVVRDTAPDIVFNLAGYGVDRSESDAGRLWAINHELVARLVDSLADGAPSRWTGQRLVHAGSALEYGLLEGVASEDRGGEPHTEYGRSKLAASIVVRDTCRASGLRAVTARLFTVYGPGEHPGRLLPTLLDARRANSRVRLSSGMQQRDFTYVEDAARGLIELGASDARPGEWVNVASGRMHTVREFAIAAAAVLNLPADRLEFGALPTRSDEMRIERVGVDRMRALVGWCPSPDLESGLARALEFERGRLHQPPSGP
jgi:nucleoside-diphosphate-sugar epimerase